MNEQQVNPRSYLRLLMLVAILGLVSAVVTFLFIFIVNQGIEVVWDEASSALGIDDRLFTFLVCTFGGLLVGLLVKLFGDHNAIFFELMQEFGETGRFEYRNVPGIVITSLVSLVSGGSLGPEAALADACGGLGTWSSDKLKLNQRETRTMGFGGLSAMLAAFITNPFGGSLLALESASGGESRRDVYLWNLFPSLLSSAVGTIVFVILAGGFFDPLVAFPGYDPAVRDLLVAIPLSIIGGIAGILFSLMLQRMRQVMQRMKQHVVVRGLIGGLGMGIIGALLPLTLFSGEDTTVDLIQDAGELGFWMLILLAISKLFATSLLLSTGWKGGYVFPIMFAGVALGMACETLFPDVPIAVNVAAVLAGALVASLKAPLFAALFAIVLIKGPVAPVVAVAVMIGGLMAAVLTQVQARRAKAAKQPEME